MIDESKSSAAMDPVWDAVVDAFLVVAPVVERSSRYGDKPALVLHGREIAHSEAPGVVDLRITQKGWTELPETVRTDARVHRDSSRRDWIELRLATGADVEAVINAIHCTARQNMTG